MDLAKQNADKPEDDEELRKKLWLKIGTYTMYMPLVCVQILVAIHKQNNSSQLLLF